MSRTRMRIKAKSLPASWQKRRTVLIPESFGVDESAAAQVPEVIGAHMKPVVFSAILILLAGLISDVLYAALDPRVRIR